MWTLFATVLGLYALMLAFLYMGQRQLIFHPDPSIGAPQAYGLTDFEDQMIDASDVQLQLWRKAPQEGFPTVVYFHGNASNLGNRAAIFAALAEQGFGVLALSYRGYGKSTGVPSESGLYRDARATLRTLAAQGTPPERTLLFGESLGTGVAVQMATEFPVAGLVLQAAYTSVAARAAEIYPYVPVNLLLKHRFDSLKKIGSIRCPLLMFHGERDATIPPAHGRALLAAAPEPKKAFFFTDVEHNDFDSATISSHVLAFAQEHGLISRDRQ